MDKILTFGITKLAWDQRDPNSFLKELKVSQSNFVLERVEHDQTCYKKIYQPDIGNFNRSDSYSYPTA